jgi:predicted XRE-type DNA-binding protein
MSAKTQAGPYTFDFLGQHLSDDESRRVFAQEMAIMAATVAVANAVKMSKISQAELAKRIGKTAGYVSQVLSGSRNVTMRTLADFLWACDLEVQDIQVSRFGQCTVSRDLMDQWLDGEGQVVARVEGLASPMKEVPVQIHPSRKLQTAAA